MENVNNSGLVGTYVLIVLQVILLVANHVCVWNLPLYILLLPAAIFVIFMIIGVVALFYAKKTLTKFLDEDVN